MWKWLQALGPFFKGLLTHLCLFPQLVKKCEVWLSHPCSAPGWGPTTEQPTGDESLMPSFLEEQTVRLYVTRKAVNAFWYLGGKYPLGSLWSSWPCPSRTAHWRLETKDHHWASETPWMCPRRQGVLLICRLGLIVFAIILFGNFYCIVLCFPCLRKWHQFPLPHYMMATLHPVSCLLPQR